MPPIRISKRSRLGQESDSEPSQTSCPDLRIDETSTPIPTSTDISPLSPVTATSLSASDHPAISLKSDIGLFFDKTDSLSSHEKLELIKNIWTPEKGFNFPKTNGRRFSHNWLSEFPGLCYSRQLDGAFCLPCVMFGKYSPNLKGSTLKTLFTQPLKVWGSAHGKLVSHFGTCKTADEQSVVDSKCNIHIDSSQLYLAFMEQTRINFTINLMIDKHAQEVRMRNRLILKSMIDTVVFLGHNNIPFYGRQAEVGEQSDGQANVFHNLLNFRAAVGDNVLREHLRTEAKESTFTSTTIQNELIQACGQVIKRKIASRILRARFFSLLAEEARDLSNKYQLALVVRYVDDETEEIREDFVKFIECEEGKTEEHIAKDIMESVSEMGVDMQNCRGQGYNCGSNTAVCQVGMAKRIRDIYPLATYFHCGCHPLNLCVEQTCQVQQVSKSMEKVKSLTNFFNLLPKRNSCLESHITTERVEVAKMCKQILEKNDPSPSNSIALSLTTSPKKYNLPDSSQIDSEKSKLIDSSRTRWDARIEDMGLFQNILPAIVHTLDEMHANVDNVWSRDTEQKAGIFLGGLIKFKFLVGLIIGRRILDYLESITSLLQKRTNNVLSAYMMISAVKGCIKNIDENIDEYHQNWYSEVLDVAKKVGIEESAPCRLTWSRFRHVVSLPINTHSEYWQKFVTKPMVNHLRVSLETRFSNESCVCANAFHIVPSLMLSTSMPKENDWKENFLTFFKRYENDMPSPTSIDAELDIWYGYWKSKNENTDLASTLSETLRAMLTVKGVFPNIYTSLRILASMPVTSCESEHSISQLSLIKSYTKNTMCYNRLSGLVLLRMHKEIPLSVDEVLDEFMKISRSTDL